MRDIDIINKAMEDAQAVLRDYIQLDRATRWTPWHVCSRFWTIKMSSCRRRAGALAEGLWATEAGQVVLVQ
ncbi:hypothetical protein SAMN03159423_0486 [Bradyrhizobium sp. NFR13]|uniref:hypothetical protein n=1 Tax=Bradyrhizobium sp. NFR13 TaxID=1566285 RepID=UPI0008ED0DDC|nr:hypothetical protein [Bradyrhizobium sp. NFR13]SFM29748.1 hypothetical protein SAMN03159423_0486 [Bradyrhizobium sp. NFR13]